MSDHGSERRQATGPGFRGPGARGPGMGGPGGMMLGGAKAKDFSGTMRKLVAYLGQHRPALAASMLIALASATFSIFGPKILGKATTKLFEGVVASLAGTGSIDLAYIGRIIAAALALYVASAILAYSQGWVMSGVSVKIAYRFRKDISEKIDRMPLRYFDGTNHGEILSRITNDVDVVGQTLSQSLSQIVNSVATVLGVLAMMLSISWRLTLVALVTVPVSLVFVGFVVKRSQKLFKQQQDQLGHVNGHVEEMYASHQVVKAFNGEARNIARFGEYNDALYATAWKSQFLSGLMMPMMGFIGNLGFVGVTILGGALAIGGSISVGDIQAFIQYVRSFNMPLTQLATISNVLQQTAASAERVFEFLSQAEEEPDRPEAAKVGGIEGRVEFKDVHFGYLPGKTIIGDFSALAEKGHKIAIVGPTGAGKTTMVKLLMRFYDVDSGAIEVDGIDVRSFARQDLRSLFGMVLQDTWLFNGTMMENIRYGRPGATDEEVREAAKTAHADHFIRALPGGYDMVINEEANNISQGQKQLLTIARAVLADPRMLILDEATSSVDTRTEILIQKAMDALMKNRTSFVIAHRLSTIKDADLILVMKDGGIVEQGSHDELLARRGFYAE
ncbi:MAG: ABC transporter ATP-binding protein, partial [Spirochaetaceae bacterium]|nr:ABC transporter ATP-binding protein [Spirochaetaceae bacterium]